MASRALLRRRTRIALSTLSLLTLIPLVSCSLYPTQPIQKTVWAAGQPALVTWLDDEQYPSLGEMGPCDVLLFWDTDTYLTTLASNVDPQSKSLQVVIPEDVLRDGSKYTLRFVTDDPYEMTIYTADFDVTADNTDADTDDGLDTSMSTDTDTDTDMDTLPPASYESTGPTSTGDPPMSMDTMAGTTFTSQDRVIVTTTTMGAMPSLYSSDRSSEPSTTMGLVPPLRPSDVSGSGSQQQQQGIGKNKYKNAGRRIDIEKIKFRVVFVIWPVLMGITMAM